MNAVISKMHDHRKGNRTQKDSGMCLLNHRILRVQPWFSVLALEFSSDVKKETKVGVVDAGFLAPTSELQQMGQEGTQMLLIVW